MCMCVCVRVYKCIYVYIYSYTFVCMYVYLAAVTGMMQCVWKTKIVGQVYTYVCIYIYLYVFVCVCVYVNAYVYSYIFVYMYGVATISRLLEIIRLLCRIQSLLWALLQKRPVILRSLLIVATPYIYLAALQHAIACYGVATISRLLEIMSLFCKRTL